MCNFSILLLGLISGTGSYFGTLCITLYRRRKYTGTTLSNGYRSMTIYLERAVIYKFILEERLNIFKYIL